MDPLQHLAAPRRPLLSARSTAKDAAGRKVFALPMIHQFEPVLASSPKSYMVANAVKKDILRKEKVIGIESAKANAIAVESYLMMPSHPQRPKSGEGVESPRVSRPQPPTGISSRTDVDIYRYSQATEKRMAIKPLFEQKRGSEGRPKRKVKQKKGVVSTESKEIGEERPVVLETKASEEDTEIILEPDEIQESSNQEEVRTGSPTPDDCFGASVGDITGLRKLEEIGEIDQLRADTDEIKSPLLLKKLDISSSYEPFLQTEGPKLTWMREVIGITSPPATTMKPQSEAKRVPMSDMVVYKTLGKDLRALGGRSVLVTVLLSSRGATHITCRADGSDSESTVGIANAELEQSKRLRPDLHVVTPKWADWIITRVHCDSRFSFYLDLTDAAGDEKRVCFSEIIQVNSKSIAVEMVALMTPTNLIISVREEASKSNNAEILLKADDLQRLALSLGKWSIEGGADQEVSSLFDDQEFLSQVATKTNVVRLGMSCSGSANDLDDSLLSGEFPVVSTDPTIDVSTRENALIDLELVDSTNLVRGLLDANKSVGTVEFLVQAYVENGILSTLRHFQQQEAIQFNVAAFIHQAASIDSEVMFNVRVEQNLEAARTSKLREIASMSIVDDMILDMIAYECRVEIHAAKYSGGFDDHYASKLQATYRMSTQKKSYDHKRNVRMRAAQMLQALQRGIIARRRYSEMKVEREKYLFYGFRSSLYHATANMEDPRLKARELSTEAERRRHAFLMQVIQGYVAQNFVDDEFRVSAQLVQEIYNEYGVVVGCSTNFGDIVVSYLGKAPDQALYARVGDSTHEFDPNAPPRVYSCSQVSAALLLGLRDQYDDTFGLSSNARRMNTEVIQQSRRETMEVEDSGPPRWMLKASLSFQQSNLDRLAGLRLTRKAAGKKSAHLVARDYRIVLAWTFNSFDSCRATWEVDIRSRRDQQRVLDTLSVDELAQHCLDLLISCVKDWGIDPHLLFEALNLCCRHCHGKAAICIVEEKFNAYAAKMNEVHGKQSVLTLREEISQELEDFEKLLALRCLDMAVDDAVTVPTSELLHIMLRGNLDEEYIRHGLSTVLPIASITEKHDLARKMLYAYANASYGDAFNLICWSCLDVAENVTVEAAQFLDKITRPTIDTDDATLFSSETVFSQTVKKTSSRPSESLAARALYLLTGSQAVRFLQFLAKVSHFNKSIQKRVLTHLAPYADEFEMHRLASAVCALEDFSIVSQLFDTYFSPEVLQCCTPVWAQYQCLFGQEKSSNARIQPETP